MIWKTTLALFIVLASIVAVAFSTLNKIELENSEPVVSLIDEDQMLRFLHRFYSKSESENTWMEIKNERMRRAIVKASVLSVKKDMYILKSDSDWQVSVDGESLFSLSENGFSVVGVTNETFPAVLLRGSKPKTSLPGNNERQAGDMLFVMQNGYFLFFDFHERSYFYTVGDL